MTGADTGRRLLTRREVRHALLRARNARVVAARLEAWPVHLRMNVTTLSELLVDGDPREQETLDFERLLFAGVPIVIDHRAAAGVVELLWPKEASGA